jgi:type I site-specific restriction endonuclease
MNKRSLSERDICTKFITPALERAGRDIARQIREEYSFTKGRVIVRGKMAMRVKSRRAGYLLSVKPNVPVAVIEAKDNRHGIGDGLQHAIGYAEALDETWRSRLRVNTRRDPASGPVVTVGVGNSDWLTGLFMGSGFRGLERRRKGPCVRQGPARRGVFG